MASQMANRGWHCSGHSNVADVFGDTYSTILLLNATFQYEKIQTPLQNFMTHILNNILDEWWSDFFMPLPKKIWSI